MVSGDNPTRADADWAPAVIAGASQTGVLGVRGLARRGVDAVCIDWNPTASGFRSVYGPALRCPNPDVEPEAWVGFMLDLASRFARKPVLIASADQFVSAIADHAEVLASGYVLSPGLHLQGLLAIKETQYDLAAKHGMPLPRTRCVGSVDDVAAFAEHAVFPCLLKPMSAREWEAFPDHHPLRRKVAVACTAERLIEYWQLAATKVPRAIAQEVIPGPDTSKRVYMACYDAGGRRIGHAMFRELRCDPLGFGPASVSEPVRDDETDEVCDNFLRSVGYSGLCEIEMKRDSRDGRPKLIEANPRLTGGGDAAPYAGVDVCWLHYLDMMGRSVQPVSPSRNDFRHIVLRTDLRAIVAYRRERLISWRDVLRSYKRPRAFYDFEPRDWRNAINTVYSAVRGAAGEIVRTGLSRWHRGRLAAPLPHTTSDVVSRG
jgi:D-aspartate ligase